MSNIASHIPGTQAHKESHSSHNTSHSEEHHSSTTQGIGNKINQGVEGLKEKLPGTTEHQATHPTSGTHGHHGLAGAGNPTGSQVAGDVPNYGRNEPGYAGTGVGGTSGTVLGANETGTGHHGHHGHHTGTGVTGTGNTTGQGVASHVPGTTSHAATHPHGTTGSTGVTDNTGSNVGGGHNTSGLSTGQKIASVIPGTKTNQAKKEGLL